MAAATKTFGTVTVTLRRGQAYGGRGPRFTSFWESADGRRADCQWSDAKLEAFFTGQPMYRMTVRFDEPTWVEYRVDSTLYVRSIERVTSIAAEFASLAEAEAHALAIRDQIDATDRIGFAVAHTATATDGFNLDWRPLVAAAA